MTSCSEIFESSSASQPISTTAYDKELLVKLKQLRKLCSDGVDKASIMLCSGDHKQESLKSLVDFFSKAKSIACSALQEASQDCNEYSMNTSTNDLDIDLSPLTGEICQVAQDIIISASKGEQMLSLINANNKQPKIRGSSKCCKNRTSTSKPNEVSRFGCCPKADEWR